MSLQDTASNSVVPPKRVLVIGAGPTGLVALRNVVERGKFEHVELWERRDDVGGVWYLDEPKPEVASNGTPRWPSPAYKGLIGNVLPEFLSFSEFPFRDPPGAPQQPFPTLKETHEYLRAFSEPYRKDGKIKLNREVVKVLELKNGKGWAVTAKDWTNGGKELAETWDAVVVSVGPYDHPLWPETEGLDELRKRGLAKHAMMYRGPKGYEGKKALVIGNANSSNDIAAQLSTISSGPVYQSIRRQPFPGFPSLESERIKMVASVSKYISKGDKFDAVLSDGTILSDLDNVHCGTGYKVLPDFIHVLSENGAGHKPFTSDDLVPFRVPSLHRIILYAYNTSLGFAGAPFVYTPFTVADVSSTWLALAWRGEVQYPDTPEDRLVFETLRIALQNKRISETENPSALLTYNILGPDEQEYAASLREDIVKARPELDKVLPVWNDEKTDVREAMFKTKYEALAYAKDKLGQIPNLAGSEVDRISNV